MKRLLSLCAGVIILTTLNVSAQIVTIPLWSEDGYPCFSAKEIAEIKSGYYYRELELSDKQYRKVFDIYLSQATEYYPVKVETNGIIVREYFVGNAQMMQKMSEPNMENVIRSRNLPSSKGPFESEKSITRRNKKMKKILSQDQYEKWSALDKADVEAYNAMMRERQAMADE